MPEIAPLSPGTPVILALGDLHRLAPLAAGLKGVDVSQWIAAGHGPFAGGMDTMEIDLSSSAAADGLFDDTMKQYNRIDVVVFAMDVITRDSGVLGLEKSLTALFNCSRAAARVMIRQRSGRMVNLLTRPEKGDGLAAASVEAASVLTRALARELAARGVAANAVIMGNENGPGAAALEAVRFLAFGGSVTGEVLAAAA